MSVVLMLLATLALITTFGAGYIWLRAWTRLGDAACWCLAGLAGGAGLGLIGLLGFLVGAPTRGLSLGATVLAVAISLGRMRQRGLAAARPTWLVGAALWWCALLAMQALLPIYTNAYIYGDWWMHYDLAELYRGLRDPAVRYFDFYSVPSRTPLFNLAAAYYLTVFGDHFAIYQLTSMIHGLALLGALLLFVRQTWAVLLALALNSFVVTNVLFPWPKIMAAGMIMACLWCYLQWRDSGAPSRRQALAWGMWVGLAIAAHTAMVLYVAAMALDHMWLRRREPGRIAAPLAWGALAAALVLAPWVIWVAAAYGPGSLVAAAPTVAAAGSAPEASWLADRILTLLGTLIPLPWLLADLRTSGWWDALLRFWYYTLPGAAMAAGLALWLRASRAPWPVPRPLAGWLLFVGLLGSVLLQPLRNPYGIAGESLAPLIALFVVLLAAALPALPRRHRLIGIGLLALEFALSRGLHTARLALGHVSGSDANLLLKQQERIVFLRDEVGAAWGMWAGLLLVAYALLIAGAARSLLAAGEDSDTMGGRGQSAHNNLPR